MEMLMTAIKVISLLGIFGFTPRMVIHAYRGINVASQQVWITAIAWVVFIWSMGWLN